MLSASREIAAAMPRGFYAPSPLDTLLTLYVAEDDARYLELTDLDVPGATSRNVVERWVAALATEGLIERCDDLLALSQHGHALVTSIIEAIYAAQRSLD
jgi:hypothetical protein